MPAVKPLYLDPATGLATESAPGTDTIAYARVSVPGPTFASDAANKAYVDSRVATGGGGSGGGGAAQLSLAEVDLGPLPVDGGQAAVADLRVTSASLVLCQISGQAPSGKDPDDVPMDAIELRAWPQDGQVVFYLRGLEGYIHDKFCITYLVGG